MFSFSEEKPGMMSVDTALEMLQTAASEIEEESEVKIQNNPKKEELKT